MSKGDDSRRDSESAAFKGDNFERLDFEGTEFESTANNLDAGLRAAFGVGEETAWLKSALATLEDTHGECTRILLRDEDEEVHLVKPLARQLLSTAYDSRRYQMLGEIARGGMGVVLKGRDGDLGRDVAMKVLREEHAHDSGMIRRFVEEAQIAGQLQHPGILPVYELGVEGSGTPYFTMKLVRGETLAAVLRDREPGDGDRTHLLGVFARVCETLAYAHAKGVIHRDLKPSNILVGSFGEVQVVDWGLAKVLERGGTRDDPSAGDADEGAAADATTIATVRSTRGNDRSLVGSVMGTPPYMSPEQARGEVEQLDERTDVFSLGAILMEIITGKTPFSGSRQQMLAAAQRGDLSTTHESLDQSAVDPPLRKLIDRCLAANARQRLRDAGSVGRELAAYLDSVQVRAREAEIAAERADARAAEERRARRLTRILATVVVTVMALGVVVGGVWIGDRNERERELLAQQQQALADLSETLGDGREALAGALASPIGEQNPWKDLASCVRDIERFLERPDLDVEARSKGEAFLSRVQRAQRDRRMARAIEEAVILGATHSDRNSWLWMEQQLRAAFADYGIDVKGDSNDAIVEKIQESDLAGPLADGLELWIATCANLMSMGPPVVPQEQLFGKVEILYRADPHPLAGAVRRLFYSPAVTADAVEVLIQDLDAAATRPRTLAWLGSLCFRTGDNSLIRRVFEEALLAHPGDFMLNFDYAYSLEALQDYEGAVRYAMRCLVIRPKTPGIWRFLGNAQRHLGEFEASRRHLQRSIELQSDHGATYVDLGATCEALEDVEAARTAYQQALKLDPENASAKKALVELEQTK